MKKPFLFLFLFAFFFLFSRASFADPGDVVTPTGLGFALGAWVSPNFSGVTQTGQTETNISLNHNLGITGQTLLVPEVWYRFSHGQILDARYSQMDSTVTQTLAVPELFQGVAFPAGTPETSHMELHWADVSYEYPIWYDHYPPESDYLNVVGDLKLMHGTFTMTNNTTGVTSSHPPINVPFPEIGLHGKFSLHGGTSAEFKAAGIFFGFEDAVGYSYDLEGGLTHRFDNFEIAAKYRNFTFYNRDAAFNIFTFRIYGPEFDAKVHF